MKNLTLAICVIIVSSVMLAVVMPVCYLRERIKAK